MRSVRRKYKYLNDFRNDPTYIFLFNFFVLRNCGLWVFYFRQILKSLCAKFSSTGYARSMFIRVSFFFCKKKKQLFIAPRRRAGRDRRRARIGLTIPSRKWQKSLFAGLREPWAFPRARRPFFTVSHQQHWRRRRGCWWRVRELTPRGLPVLLSLFMSGDIATLLLRRFSRSPYKAPRRTLRPHFRLVPRSNFTTAGVNTLCKMRPGGVILLLPVLRDYRIADENEKTPFLFLNASRVELRWH